MLRHQTSLFTLLAALAGAPVFAATPLPAPKPAADKPALELERWEAPNEAYTIAYPKGWEVKADESGATGAVFSNTAEATATGGRADTITVSTQPATTDEKTTPAKNFKAWAKTIKDAATSKVTEFKLVAENQAVVANAPALRLVYDGKEQDGTVGRFMHWTFEKGGTQYVIFFRTEAKRFAKLVPIEQAVTRSFTIGPAPQPGAEVAKPVVPEPAVEKPATTDAKPALAANAFESTDIGVKLTFPEAWSQRKVPSASILLMLLPSQAKGGSRPATILLTTDATAAGGQPPSFKAQTDAAVATLKASAVPDAKVIESAEIKIGKQPAMRVLIGGRNTVNKADMRHLYLFVPHGQHSLTLSAQSTAEEYKAVREAFDAIVNNMELTKPAAATKKAN